MTPQVEGEAGDVPVSPDDLLSIDDVLKRWPGRFTENELREGMRNGEIAYVQKGRRRWLTMDGIREYLTRHLVTPCARDAKSPSSRSENTGSPEKAMPVSSTDTGTTEELLRSAAEAAGLRILNRQNSTSPRSLQGSPPKPCRPRLSS